MTHLTITHISPAQISGLLSIGDKRFSIPVKISGSGMSHFRINNMDEKILELSPDIIHVSKSDIVIFTMTEIKITRMFGKTLLEGDNAENPRSSVVIDISKIKQIYT